MITNEHEVGAPYVNFSSALNTFTQSKDAILILDGYMIAFGQISANEPMMWPTIENEPLNENQISHLATMAFPTLFPDGKGDPTNQALLRDIPLQERVKHLFLKQNPGEAHLTIDELCEMAGSSNSAAFMSKVSRYVSNIAGTNAYWYKVREELKAIIMLLVNNATRTAETSEPSSCSRNMSKYTSLLSNLR